MNAPSFAGYYRHERIQEEIITPYEAQIEALLFGLRTNGARISPIICTKKLHSLEQDGLIYIQNDTIFPTKT